MTTPPTTEAPKKEPLPRFARWLEKQIETHGAEGLGQQLAVDRTTVWAWLRYAKGEKNGRSPRPPMAKKLVEFADGALLLRDIY